MLEPKENDGRFAPRHALGRHILLLAATTRPGVTGDSLSGRLVRTGLDALYGSFELCTLDSPVRPSTGSWHLPTLGSRVFCACTQQSILGTHTPQGCPFSPLTHLSFVPPSFPMSICPPRPLPCRGPSLAGHRCMSLDSLHFMYATVKSYKPPSLSVPVVLPSSCSRYQLWRGTTTADL